MRRRGSEAIALNALFIDNFLTRKISNCKVFSGPGSATIKFSQIAVAKKPPGCFPSQAGGINLPSRTVGSGFCGNELILEFPTKSMPSGFRARNSHSNHRVGVPLQACAHEVDM